MTLQKLRERILRAWVDSYLDLRDQLAAEREKAKQWQSNYAALHDELLEERRLHDLIARGGDFLFRDDDRDADPTPGRKCL